MRSPRVEALENAIVQHLDDKIKDKSQPIRLLCMGNGNLLSDFIALEKFILAGFTNIHVDCVDPTGIDPEKIEKIQEFFAEYKKDLVTMRAHKSIDEVSKEDDRYTALLATDSSSLSGNTRMQRFCATADLMKAYRLLADDGVLGLGWWNEDMFLGPQVKPILLSPHLAPVPCDTSCFIYSLCGNLTLSPTQKTDLTIYLPSFDVGGVANAFFLGIALEAERRKFRYANISLLLSDPPSEESREFFNNMIEHLFPEATLQVYNLEDLSADEILRGEKCDLAFTVSGLQRPDNAITSTANYFAYPDGRLVHAFPMIPLRNCS